MGKHILITCVFLGLTAVIATGKTADISVKLLCDYSESPLNIDRPVPAFSWIVDSDKRNHHQTAYQLEVASSRTLLENGEPDLWQSGMVGSDNTLHVDYEGKKLRSNRTYFWRVTLRDNYGNVIQSKPASFTTALLHPEVWRARWIGADPQPGRMPEKGFFMDRSEQFHDGLEDTVVHNGRSLLLRRSFYLDKEIESATVHVSGLGFYKLYINGEGTGNLELTPSKTNYAEEILYDTYQVGPLLKKGENAVGMHLGNGWYNPYKKWWKEYRMQWFGPKKAILQLHVQYVDGTSEVIATDEQWKTAPGPVVFNCVYDGEIYDANQEKEAWNTVSYDASGWHAARVYGQDKGLLRAQRMPGTQVVEEITPVSASKIGSNAIIYDMGQNFAGWVRLAVRGRKDRQVLLRFAEDLHPDGTLDDSSNERARATATYVLKGGGIEIYQPLFTYFGFRYVEMSSRDALPEIVDLTGCVVHTANGHTGSFQSGHDLINKIHHATVWSQKSNMIGYPMDCPQRDERLGWMGDAQVSVEQALFNFDMALFFRNWLTGIRKNQDGKTGDIPIISPRPYIKDEGIGWSSTYIIMTWAHYLHYGDIRVLEEHYPSMTRYMDYLDQLSEDFILPKGWIGDWGSLVEGWKEGEPESVPTAFYFFNASILSGVAGILGRKDDRQHYLALSDSIRNAYNKAYFHPDEQQYGDGSQMANAFPLYLGLVPQTQEDAVLSHLVYDIRKNQDDHLTTGVLGTKYMIDALSRMGRQDVAWILATQTTYPSWHEMMKKYNTVCEFWTLKQSKNHVMMGSIDSWFYTYLAGIRVDPEYPAFKSFVIDPFFPENLDWVSASTYTIRGEISSEWTRSADGISMNVEVPFNTLAVLRIDFEPDCTIRVDGIPVDSLQEVQYLKYDNGKHILRVTPGNYSLKIG